MRIPIHMISLATSFLWIFLLAFTVSAFYSMAEVRLNFGKPQTTTISNDELLYSIPVAVTNGGFYDLDYFNISSVFRGIRGTMAEGATFIPAIKKGDTLNTTQQVKLDITDLLQIYQSYMFNDSELQMNTTVNMKVAGFLSVQISSNTTLPWGAPFYNLTVGPPSFAPQFTPNLTASCKVMVPVNFENHAFFDLSGTLQLLMYNSTNALVGEGQTNIAEPRGSTYNGSVEIDVPVTDATSSGHFEVFFAAPFFNFGPRTIRYGV
jgi:hypothetical protein